MQYTAKKLEIFVITVIIAGIGIIYAFKQNPRPVRVAQHDSTEQVAPMGQTSVRPDSTDQVNQQMPAPSAVFEYKGVDGKNALELLKASHTVDAKHYSFGDLVTSIDGITPDSSHFWAMYVNDQFSQVGASSYTTKSTDTIKWEVDAVVDTTK